MKLKSLFILFLMFGALIAPFAVPTINSEPNLVVDTTSKVLTLSKWGGLSTIHVSQRTSGVKVENVGKFTDYYWILEYPPAPNENKFTLYMDLTGCELLYQAPLTQDEINKGYKQPENVTGSYAIYSPYKDGVFQTGKVGHIYRPLVTDSNGDHTWGVLSYKDGILTTTVDEAWLKSAKYPVKVDPTFGYTSEGANAITMTAGQLYGGVFTVGAGSTYIYGVDVRVCFDNTEAGTNFKAGIWTNADGGALIVVSTGQAQDIGYETATIANTALTHGASYGLCVIASANTPDLSCDTSGGVNHIDTANSYATPGVWDWSTTGDDKYSIYCTYVECPEAGAGDITITDLTDTTNVYTKLKYYSLQVVVTEHDTATRQIVVKLYNATDNKLFLKGATLDTAPAWSVLSGDGFISAGTCSWNAGTNTAIFKFMLDWDYACSVNPDNIKVSFMDTGNYNSTAWYTATATFYPINRLVVYGFVGNATYVESSNWLQLNGTIRYALTQDGNAVSSSYPPDAQFTSVDIQDQFDVEWDSDATIVNGFFTVIFPVDGMGQTALFYAYVDGVSPYDDAKTADGRYWAVYLTSEPEDVWAAIFAYFGITNPMPTINAAITNLSGFFLGSITNFVSFISSIATFLMYAVGSVVYWFNAIVITWYNPAVGSNSIIEYVDDILSAVYGGIDFFTLFWTPNMIAFVPIVVAIAWIASLDPRSKNRGISTLELAIADVQSFTWIIGYFISVFQTIFSFIIDLAFQFWGAIRG